MILNMIPNYCITADYFELVHHCTFKALLWQNFGISHVYRAVYAHEHIFNGAGIPQKFSSELELACLSAKIFHLKRFAIYSIKEQVVWLYETL